MNDFKFNSTPIQRIFTLQMAFYFNRNLYRGMEPMIVAQVN